MMSNVSVNLNVIDPTAQSYSSTDSASYKGLWSSLSVSTAEDASSLTVNNGETSAVNSSGLLLSQQPVATHKLSRFKITKAESVSLYVDVDDLRTRMILKTTTSFKKLVNELKRAKLLPETLKYKEIFDQYYVTIKNPEQAYLLVTEWIGQRVAQGKKVTIGDLADQASKHFNNTPLNSVLFERKAAHSSEYNGVIPSAPPAPIELLAPKELIVYW